MVVGDLFDVTTDDSWDILAEDMPASAPWPGRPVRGTPLNSACLRFQTGSQGQEIANPFGRWHSM